MDKGIILKGIIVECGIVSGFLVEAHNKGAINSKRVSKVMLIDLIAKGIPAKGVSIFQNQLVIDPELYRSLPKINDELEIIESIKSDEDSNKVIGYLMSSSNGKQLKISISETWKLAASGCVKDTVASIGKENKRKYIVRKAV